MHSTFHPLFYAGLALVALTIVAYAVAAGIAMLRVQRQYNGAIRGMGGLRIGAALAAIARLWPLAIVGVAGITLVFVGR